MFEDRLEGALGNSRALADLDAETENGVRQLGCRKFRVAAASADAHSDVDHPDGGMVAERLLPSDRPAAHRSPKPAPVASRWPSAPPPSRRKAGSRTPSRCGTACPASGNGSWADRCTPGRLARSPAQRRISVSSPPGSSTSCSTTRSSWSPARGSSSILDATLLQVDPTTYGERQAKAAAQRDVKATQSSDGLRTLVARGTSGDVTMFLALVDAIAQALADEGDEDPYPVRKSKAIGIAAYPDRAQDLLSRGRHREDPRKDPRTRSSPTRQTRPIRGPMICRPRMGDLPARQLPPARPRRGVGDARHRPHRRRRSAGQRPR